MNKIYDRLAGNWISAIFCTRHMAKPRRNAREDILNTAESLFAARGIENVSLRAINAEAGYSAAALHYHFKTKENLLEALLLNRQEPVMSLRASLVESLQDEGKPDVSDLAEALVMPFAQLILSDHERGLSTVKFFFRTYVERHAFALPEQITEESLNIFDPLLARALPDLSQSLRRIKWLVATEAAFQGLANMDSILRTASATLEDENRRDYVNLLIEFIAGGLEYNS